MPQSEEVLTPLPWIFDGQEHRGDLGQRYYEIKGGNGEDVIGEYGHISCADAEYIVKACNAHGLLLNLLAELEGQASNCSNPHPELEKAIAKARDAIATLA